MSERLGNNTVYLGGAKDFYEQLVVNPEWNAAMAEIDDPNNIDNSEEVAKKGSYHGLRHARAVEQIAEEFLSELGVDEDTIYLAKSAALLHDIGLTVDEDNHEKEGEVFAQEVLKSSSLPDDQRAKILHAIKDHRRGDDITNVVDAAVLLGDKLDVTKDRLRPEAMNLDAVNRDVANISKVSLDVSDKSLDVHYETDDGYIPTTLFSEWPKAIEAPKKVAEFIGRDFNFYINGEPYLHGFDEERD